MSHKLGTVVYEPVFFRDYYYKVDGGTPNWKRWAKGLEDKSPNFVERYFLNNQKDYLALKIAAVAAALAVVGVLIFHCCPAAHHVWHQNITPFFHTKADFGVAVGVGSAAGALLIANSVKRIQNYFKQAPVGASSEHGQLKPQNIRFNKKQ